MRVSADGSRLSAEGGATSGGGTARSQEPRADSRAWRAALSTAATAAVVRLLLAAWLPLFPDETYYWEWSRRLAPGYFDHPFGIALLIRAGTALWSALGLEVSALAVRLGPVLAGALATFAVVATARRIGGAEAALRAALVVTCLPLAAAGLVLATPDAPLLAATAATIYCIVRALYAPLRSAASFRWWIAAGVALGLAFCSKYTAILLPLGMLIAVVARRELRSRLREPGPYVAAAVAALVFLPVVLWNARHEWISFAFQLQHGLSASRGSWLLRELDLVGGQAGLASPILFLMMAIAVWSALRAARVATDSGASAALAIVAVTTLAFFAYSALRKHVEANWPAPAYIPATVLVATHPWGDRGRRWLRAGWLFAGALALIVYVHAVVPVLPIPARKDPVAKAFGWDRVATRVVAARDSARRERTVFVAADRYQDASEIAFHLARARGGAAGTAPDAATFVYAVNQSGRRNQYDLWPGFPADARAGDDLLLVLDDSDDFHSSARRLAPFYAEAVRGDRVELARRDEVHGARRLYWLRGWKGGWPEPEAAPR